jgi:hypothetical protein
VLVAMNVVHAIADGREAFQETQEAHVRAWDRVGLEADALLLVDHVPIEKHGGARSRATERSTCAGRRCISR